MDAKFLEEFGGDAYRYDWQGSNGAACIEFMVPVDKMGRFTELTIRREAA